MDSESDFHRSLRSNAEIELVDGLIAIKTFVEAIQCRTIDPRYSCVRLGQIAEELAAASEVLALADMAGKVPDDLSDLEKDDD